MEVSAETDVIADGKTNVTSDIPECMSSGSLKDVKAASQLKPPEEPMGPV